MSLVDIDSQLESASLERFSAWSRNLGTLAGAELGMSKESLLFRNILETTGFSKNVIEIFDHWLDVIVEKQISGHKLETPSGTITFSNAVCESPTAYIGSENVPLLPKLARERGYTYSGSLYVDATLTPRPGSIIAPTSKKGDPLIERHIEIGKIPIMLGSKRCYLHGNTIDEKIQKGECPNDPLSYFIIKGTEKSIIIQEKLRESMCFTFVADAKGRIEGRVTCATPTGTTVVTMAVGRVWQTLKVKLHHMKKNHHIPLFILFRFLGYTPEQGRDMILQYVAPQHRKKVYFGMQSSLAKERSRTDHVYYIARKRELGNSDNLEKTITDDIHRDLFPNVATKAEKARHLGMMAAHMMCVLAGNRKLDNRDSWGNKRLETAGRSMEQLLNGLLNKVFVDAQCQIDKGGKTRNNSGALLAKSVILPSTITEQFESSFGANSWGVKGSFAKENITDTLKRETPMTVYSQNGRVNTPACRRAKQPSIRMVQDSQLGYICLAETPEGEGCGLVKNLCLTTYISLARSLDDIMAFLAAPVNGHLLSYYQSTVHTHTLTVNGKITGFCSPSIREAMIAARRCLQLPKDCCIFLNKEDLTMEYYCDSSRPTRPLLIVTDGNLVIDTKNLWGASMDELLAQGALELVDSREQCETMLAMSPHDVRDRAAMIHKLQGMRESPTDEYPLEDIEAALAKLQGKMPYTHSEIDPIAIFGIASGLIPMANSNQGPRTTYQASMCKQALSSYHYNHHERFDSTFKVLLHASRPMFESEISEAAGLNIMPAGQTPIIAFYALADNNEDAIIVNADYINAGNFDLIKYSSHKSIEKQHREVKEEFKRPEPRRGEQEGRYSGIGDDGFPIIGAYIRRGDCIIGKIRTVASTGKVENASRFAGIGEEGYVTRVLVTHNTEHQRIVKVKLRQTRSQIAGDKLASRFSQKGTIATIMESADLPRVASGINKGLTPDFIIGPHCLASRMTMAKPKEMLASKAALYSGERVDATTFHQFDVEHYREQLRAIGMDPDGNEWMEHPNGKPIKDPVFVAPCYYQALRHHVLDKVQMRARGTINPTSHQPVSGRSNEGGLRVGEMERDSMISHGATSLLLERLMIVSDKYRTVYCSTCGNIAIFNNIKSKTTCRVCGDKAAFGTLTYPYVLKLIKHMLIAMGINTVFKTVPEVKEGSRPEEKFLV